MSVAQRGVTGFVAAAMGSKVPFAMETVFSHWSKNKDGSVSSKIDVIRDLQKAGHFVLLAFVGLSSPSLSVGRVETRKSKGGHAVPFNKLIERYPRTQQAINAALDIADACILFDNSRSERLAFTPVHIRHNGNVVYDIRRIWKRRSFPISAWLDIVVPG